VGRRAVKVLDRRRLPCVTLTPCPNRLGVGLGSVPYARSARMGRAPLSRKRVAPKIVNLVMSARCAAPRVTTTRYVFVLPGTDCRRLHHVVGHWMIGKVDRGTPLAGNTGRAVEPRSWALVRRHNSVPNGSVKRDSLADDRAVERPSIVKRVMSSPCRPGSGTAHRDEMLFTTSVSERTASTSATT